MCLLESCFKVYFAAHATVSQGVNQWCNVKLSALPPGSWDEMCLAARSGAGGKEARAEKAG